MVIKKYGVEDLLEEEGKSNFTPNTRMKFKEDLGTKSRYRGPTVSEKQSQEFYEKRYGEVKPFNIL